MKRYIFVLAFLFAFWRKRPLRAVAMLPGCDGGPCCAE